MGTLGSASTKDAPVRAILSLDVYLILSLNKFGWAPWEAHRLRMPLSKPHQESNNLVHLSN
eukprot:1143632-Pelagomonas_calceolata.AAC.7